MPPFSEAERKWANDFLGKGDGSKVGPPTGGLAAPISRKASPGNGESLRDAQVGTDAVNNPFMSDKISADAAVPDYVKRPIRGGFIETDDPDGTTLPSNDEFWVDFIEDHDGMLVKSKEARAKMLSSPDYVDFGIDGLKAQPNVMNLKASTMQLSYKRGDVVTVPLNAVKYHPAKRAPRFVRDGSHIFPVDERSNYLYDVTNTPNVVLCATWVRNELMKRAAQRLELAELTNTFAGAVAGLGGSAGGAQQPAKGGGSSRPMPRRVAGGHAGNPTVGTGKPIGAGGGSAPKIPKPPGFVKTGQTSGDANVGKPAGAPTTSMRLPETPKGPAKPTGGGGGTGTPTGKKGDNIGKKIVKATSGDGEGGNQRKQNRQRQKDEEVPVIQDAEQNLNDIREQGEQLLRKAGVPIQGRRPPSGATPPPRIIEVERELRRIANDPNSPHRHEAQHLLRQIGKARQDASDANAGLNAGRKR